jgi:hypothetical protein
LIPEELSATKRLLWLRKAKASGILGEKKPPVGGKLPGRHDGPTIKETEYNALPLGGPFEKKTQEIKEGKVALIKGE